MKLWITIFALFTTFCLSAQKTFIRTNSELEFRRIVDSLRTDFKTKIESKQKNFLNVVNTQIVYMEKDTFQVFTPTERATALFLANDYPSLLNDIVERLDCHYFYRSRDYKRAKIKFFWKIFNSNVGEIYFINDLDHERENIIDSINHSALDSDEKDFLKLYLASILLHQDLRRFDADQLNRDAEIFLEKYKNSKYSEYVENVIYIKLKPMNFGMGFGLFSGYNTLNGNISSYFKNNIPIGVNMELGYKRILLKGEFSASLSQHLKKSFDYKNNILTADSTHCLIDGSLNVGYALLDKTKYTLTPFIGIGRQSISLSKNIDMLFYSTLNFGVDLDWKYSNKIYFGIIYEGQDKMSWHLRLRLGYTQLKNEDSRFNGSLIYTKIEIGFYSNTMKRIRWK
jgi:hypothetical protein